jgi:RND family efflux transporter MFP subunit
MKARIFWMAAALVLIAGIVFRVAKIRSARQETKAEAVETALVRSARVVRADLSDKASFTGSIRPRNEVDVFSKVSGRVESLPIEIGDRVKSGQILAVIEHKEISWQAKAAQATLLVAKAGLDGAKLEFDRTMTLFQGGSASQAMVDGVKVKLSLAEAQLAQAEAAAGLANQTLANATVVAPIAGAVTRRPVNQGANVGANTVVATLQDVATLKLEASVDAASFPKIAKGSTAEVFVDALPGERFPGKVTVLSPSLDQVSRRAAIEIEVDNSSGKLLPNMFARADVVVGVLKGALSVPRAAVYEGGGAPVVFRVRAGKVQALRPKLGPIDGDRIAVLEGLQEGDEVATSSLPSLADGSPVKVSEASVSGTGKVN